MLTDQSGSSLPPHRIRGNGCAVDEGNKPCAPRYRRTALGPIEGLDLGVLASLAPRDYCGIIVLFVSLNFVVSHLW